MGLMELGPKSLQTLAPPQHKSENARLRLAEAILSITTDGSADVAALKLAHFRPWRWTIVLEFGLARLNFRK
jgi:hypothetical protein